MSIIFSQFESLVSLVSKPDWNSPQVYTMSDFKPQVLYFSATFFFLVYLGNHNYLWLTNILPSQVFAPSSLIKPVWMELITKRYCAKWIIKQRTKTRQVLTNIRWASLANAGLFRRLVTYDRKQNLVIRHTRNPWRMSVLFPYRSQAN